MAKQRKSNILSNIGNFIFKMCSSSVNKDAISSKIVIGSITYVMIVLAIIIVMFVNPELSGLSEIIITLIITSSSLLGLTTYENIKHPHGGKLLEEVENDEKERDGE